MSAEYVLTVAQEPSWPRLPGSPAGHKPAWALQSVFSGYDKPEQTLTFVPKYAVLLGLLLFTADADNNRDYTANLFAQLGTYGM